MVARNRPPASRRAFLRAAAATANARFARSLEMRTRGHEHEDPPKVAANKDARPEQVRVGVHEYRRATIHGEMTVTKSPLVRAGGAHGE